MQDDYVFWTREPQISGHSLETAPRAENRGITKATGTSLNGISVFTGINAAKRKGICPLYHWMQ